VEKGSCVGATTLLAAKWVVARLCEGEVRSPPIESNTAPRRASADEDGVFAEDHAEGLFYIHRGVGGLVTNNDAMKFLKTTLS
jgi:hypothetical protein